MRGVQPAAEPRGLPNRSTLIGRLAANLLLNAIENADALQGAGGGRRRMRSMDVVELAAGMRPAGRLANPAVSYR